MEFNPSPPTVMHVDINSCFATIEQQANPLLRGKPVVVAAYTENHGCILTASREAKKLGIKTGMRVWEGKNICPKLIVLAPDPEKYRFINKKLKKLLGEYTADLSVESIDEMVMDLKGAPVLELNSTIDNRKLKIVVENRESKVEKTNPFSILNSQPLSSMLNSLSSSLVDRMVCIAKEIKTRINNEIGDWISVSIGIAPNRYLAKIASGLHKPDGLDMITKENIEVILGGLALEDLCGIKEGNSQRLKAAGIWTPLAFYDASADRLERAFHSIVGYHWWLRLHGYNDESLYKSFNAAPENQKSFGQSYSMSQPFTPTQNGLYQILYQLVAKMGRRLREAGFVASGIHASCYFADHTYWAYGIKKKGVFYADSDFYHLLKKLLTQAPDKPVRILAVSCFDLTNNLYRQDSLFTEENRKKYLTAAIDKIHDRWGDGTITSARVLGTAQQVLDRIAFGKVARNTI